MAENIISIIAGLLFMTSETLPYITKMEHTGIIHFIINIGNAFIKKFKTQLPELDPLLNDIETGITTENLEHNKTLDLISEQLNK